MKKILLITLAIAGFAGNLCAEPAADKLKAFIKMEKGHKDDWFSFMKNHAGKKADLLKKHHDEWSDFKQDRIAEWGSGKPITEAQLNQAIALHKKQNADWKSFGEEILKTKADIITKHAKELAQFESSKITAPAIEIPKNASVLEKSVETIKEGAEKIGKEIEDLE